MVNSVITFSVLPSWGRLIVIIIMYAGTEALTSEGGSAIFTLPVPYELSIADDPAEACKHNPNGTKIASENISLCFSTLGDGVDESNDRAMYTVISANKDTKTTIKLRIRKNNMLISPDAEIKIGHSEPVRVVTKAEILALFTNRYNGDGTASDSANSNRSIIRFVGELNRSVFEVKVLYQDVRRSHAIYCFHEDTLDSDFYLTDLCQACVLDTFDTLHSLSSLGWRQNDSPVCNDTRVLRLPTDEDNQSVHPPQKEDLLDDTSRQGFPLTDDLPVPFATKATEDEPSVGKRSDEITLRPDANDVKEEWKSTNVGRRAIFANPNLATDDSSTGHAALLSQVQSAEEMEASFITNKILISNGRLQVNTGGISDAEVGAKKTDVKTASLRKNITLNKTDGKKGRSNFSGEIKNSKSQSGQNEEVERVSAQEDNSELSEMQTESSSIAASRVQAASTIQNAKNRDTKRSVINNSDYALTPRVQSDHKSKRAQTGRSVEVKNSEQTGIFERKFLWATQMLRKKNLSQSDGVTHSKAQDATVQKIFTNSPFTPKEIQKDVHDKQEQNLRSPFAHENRRPRRFLDELAGKALEMSEKAYQQTARQKSTNLLESDKLKGQKLQNTTWKIFKNVHSTLTLNKYTTQRRPGVASRNSPRYRTSRQTHHIKHVNKMNVPTQFARGTLLPAKHRPRPRNTTPFSVDNNIQKRSAGQTVRTKQKVGSMKSPPHTRGQKLSSTKRQRARRNSVTPESNDTSRRQTVSCSLHLVADHLFFNEMGDRNPAKTVNLMVSVVNGADAVFRAADFDGDGKGDNIGFVVKNITIIHNSSAAFYSYSRTNGDAFQYLRSFSTGDFSDVCLGVAFTAIDFDRGVVGLAWYASSLNGDKSGICGQRVYLASEHRSFSFNTAIVTFLNHGSSVYLENAILTLVHEFGHCFGSSHDDMTGKWLSGPAGRSVSGPWPNSTGT